jgi:hypothetical protein
MKIDLVQTPGRLPAAPATPKQRVTATLCKSFERRDREWGWAAGRSRSQWIRRFAAAAVADFFYWASANLFKLQQSRMLRRGNFPTFVIGK